MANKNYLAQHGLELLSMGYEPICIAEGTKYPKGVDAWQTLTPDEDLIRHWVESGYTGVGLRTGRLAVIDLDFYDEGIVQELIRYCHSELGPAPVRIGSAPKAALFYRYSDSIKPQPKRTSASFLNWDDSIQRVEVLGVGQQVVAFADHPDTGRPYEWLQTLPELESLSEILPTQVEKVLALAEKLCVDAGLPRKQDAANGAGDYIDPDWDDDAIYLATAKSPLGISLDEARNTLQWVPSTDRDVWFRVGMALYHEFSGAVEAFELWVEWSKTTEADNFGGVTWSRWTGFEVTEQDIAKGRRIVTMRYVRSLAESQREIQDDMWFDSDRSEEIEDGAGETDSAYSDFAEPLPDFDSRETEENDETVSSEAVETEKQKDSNAFSLFSWGDLDPDQSPPHQLVEDLLAVGQMSLISAQPNTGKSAFWLEMGLCVASGTKWRGEFEVDQGPVLYVAAESPESIKARMLAHLKRDGSLYGCPMSVVQDPIALTTPEQRAAFKKKLIKWRKANPDGSLIIIDTFRNATPGLEENDSKAMGEVISFLHRAARKLNVHISVVHHTTKAGISYAGSGQFGAIVDTELMLQEGEKEEEGLIVATVKQQRSMNSKNSVYRYKIEGQATGRTTNFGKPETAPVAVHVSEADWEFLQAERADDEANEVDRQRDADMWSVVEAMKEGKTTRADLIEATKLSQPRVNFARDRGVEKGLLGVAGEGRNRRYMVLESNGKGISC